MGSAKRDGRQLMDGVTMALLAAVKEIIILGGKASLHHSMADPKVTCALNQPSLCLLDLLLIDVNKTVCRQNIPLDRQCTLKKKQQQKRNFSSSPHLKLFSYNEFHILLVI